MILICSGYQAHSLADGLHQIVLDGVVRNDQEPVRMNIGEVAEMLGCSLRTVDRLSHRRKDPLPFHRGKGRPFAYQHEINQWLLAPPLGGRPPPFSSSIRTVFGSPPKKRTTSSLTPE